MKSLTASDLEAQVDRDWVPFTSWLDEYVYARDYGDETQWDWWMSNGLSFKFLRLPAELRIAIYKIVTSSYVWPEGVPLFWDFDSKVRVFDPTVRNHQCDRWKDSVGSDQYHLDPAGARPPSATAMVEK